jgi:hypothetical protein
MAKEFIKDDSVAKVIDEIGTGPVSFTKGNIDDLREALLKGGYSVAEVKASQLAGTDANLELMRVMEIMQKHNLSPDAGAEVLNNLFQIKDGHW